MQRTGLTGLLALALALPACDDVRGRPEPFALEAEQASLSILQPSIGETVGRRQVVSPGLVTRIEGRSLPVPSRIELRAHTDDEADPFFLSNLDVRTADLQAEYLVRGGPTQLQGAASVTIVGSLLTPTGHLLLRTRVTLAVQ